VLHVDMDAFFASVEQLDHPEWRDRPVIVGGSPDGRGVVSAASYEARRFGVHSAMPSAIAARLCPDAVWAPPRFRRYAELSGKVFDILRSRTPCVEVVSIDEAFADVSPSPHDDTHPVEQAEAIQADVGDLGLSCSIGVATSKTVAKIASDMEKPHGLVVVSPGEEADFLAPLDVSVLPGVGGKTSARLKSLGILTLGDLAALDEGTASDVFGSYGPGVVLRARGIDQRPVATDHERKSVSHERTFRHDVSGRSEVEHAVADLVQRVCARLRDKGLAGRTVSVKLRYADFTTKTAQTTLETPTDLDTVVLPAALSLLDGVWRAGAGLRLLGVGVSGFGRPVRQMLLSEEDDEDRERSLIESVDEVRRRYGREAVAFGMPEPHREEEDGHEKAGEAE
jgi:DNA polymerase-4